jgi:hypothetical protein
MREPKRLRELAIWYRDQAERASNPAIWDARLRTAENLEREALELEDRLEGDAPRGERWD